MFFTVKHPSKPPSLNDSGLRSIQKFIRVSSWNENIVDTGLGRLTPNFGAGARTRTLDIRFWRPTLYQLSYTYKLERVSRFELPTFCLASRRSTPELHPHLTSNISSWIRTNLGYDRQRPISIMDSSQPLGTMLMLEFYFEQVPVHYVLIMGHGFIKFYPGYYHPGLLFRRSRLLDVWTRNPICAIVLDHKSIHPNLSKPGISVTVGWPFSLGLKLATKVVSFDSYNKRS